MKISVNPEMLTIAREIRGMTQKELSRRSGISQGKISRYEGGIVAVIEQDVTRLANALKFPEGFFYLVGRRYGVDPSEVFHRKRTSLSAIDRKRIDALTNMHRIGADLLFGQFEQITEYAIPSFPSDAYEDVSETASLVRASWSMPSGPVNNLMERLEQASCLIFVYDFGSEKLDETAQWIDPSPPIVLINRFAPGDRVRFSLAHALGHLVMHRNRPPSTTIEKEANEFAAAFLMPEDEVRDELEPVTIQHMLELKQRWKVSMAALIRRARDLDVIGERRYNSLFQQLSRLGYRKNEPFEIPREKPQLVQLILDSYKGEFGYNDDELAQLLRIRVEDFHRWYSPHDDVNRKIISFPN